MAIIEIGYNRARCSVCKKEAYLNESGHYTVPPANYGGCGVKWTGATVLYTFPYEAGTKEDIIKRLKDRWPALSSITGDGVVSAGALDLLGNWDIKREKRDGKFFERSETQAETV
jgi:hypothetical protein